EDYVIATGKQYAVRDFVKWSAAELGVKLAFSGNGTEEIATVAAVNSNRAPSVRCGDVVMRVDPRYFRPAEVETLLGDPSKAKKQLGWTPTITPQDICAEMVAADLKIAQRHALLREHGMDVPVALEA
ncbi:GDP-mannose 4,6-dehydratase, partial [Roseobacter sp. CCS2]|uniref:GDP-mannose 4,6-dehydratase n=1 Tax=Roseobacter sp. CCS2 TaxID=391593 RepID=UPI0000F3F161